MLMERVSGVVRYIGKIEACASCRGVLRPQGFKMELAFLGCAVCQAVWGGGGFLIALCRLLRGLFVQATLLLWAFM